MRIEEIDDGIAEGSITLVHIVPNKIRWRVFVKIRRRKIRRIYRRTPSTPQGQTMESVINQIIITVEDPEIFQVGPWEWDFIDFNFLPGETDSFNYYVHEYQTEQGTVNVSSKVAYLSLVYAKNEEPMEGVDEWLKGWSLAEYTYNNKSLFCLSSSADPKYVLKTNRKMGGPGSSPCASCKLLRRRCAKDCIFAPYFPPDDPHKFAIVHKVFGASNVSKMLQELPVHQRADAVNSLVFEANARVRDPVYGCVGAISYLQNQVSQLQMQLAVAQAEILCIQMQNEPTLQSHHQVLELDQEHKALLLPNNNNNNINNCNNNNNNLGYAMSSGQFNSNFASPSSIMQMQMQMQMQDPLKQESLWT
ncbi:Lateral organ boundaries LOB [Arabidopsis thaliana x Arabidopsis arenosa]|uniref:Lateral organ boundaries LOB n=4 Tax=Brassicaceae TaxID=3700 RepID=A0A8T2A7Q4_9BRAS|nr:Lateral organ boundaries LOB [Arabidopsis thaliana x Arabidopsis arenosa]